jgi:hypothetical protein
MLRSVCSFAAKPKPAAKILRLSLGAGGAD